MRRPTTFAMLLAALAVLVLLAGWHLAPLISLPVCAAGDVLTDPADGTEYKVIDVRAGTAVEDGWPRSTWLYTVRGLDKTGLRELTHSQAKTFRRAAGK